ncbi:hypothetical protein [Bosea vaviloviae]|uniref:Uncharacterized protein n=1 Tax=Bosea vaviloviae TaxID=1526658 RepID=A0A0N1FG20_9HYPH|nr:hypothetical protein [Bosea vaviloviae]KPH79361.1 hypothetical protein AE618_18880 [Bosea vaviloviae]
MSALETFLATTKRIEALITNAANARRIPDRQASIAKSVRIDTPSWTVPAEQELAYAAAEALRGRLVADYQAAGEQRRDSILVEVAAELHALRAILPQQAAAVAIDLGQQARMLQHEAQGGTV